jgi:hypothetical protein
VKFDLRFDHDDSALNTSVSQLLRGELNSGLTAQSRKIRDTRASWTTPLELAFGHPALRPFAFVFVVLFDLVESSSGKLGNMLD